MANFLEDNLEGSGAQGLDTDNLDPEVGDVNSWVRVQTAGFGLLGDLNIAGDGISVYSTENAACYNSTAPGSANYEVVAEIYNGLDTDNCKVGVTLRNPSGGDARRYTVEWDNNANVIQIVKVDADNGHTVLGSTYSYSGPGEGNTFDLKGTVSGSATTTIKAYLNGAEVLSRDDSSSPITAAGYAGLSIRGASTGYTRIRNVTAAVLTLAEEYELVAATWSVAATFAAASLDYASGGFDYVLNAFTWTAGPTFEEAQRNYDILGGGAVAFSTGATFADVTLTYTEVGISYELAAGTWTAGPTFAVAETLYNLSTFSGGLNKTRPRRRPKS
jgi:hypothetical protein